ncbi:hypothetical protein [Streptomyces sp. GS7]|uniref:hypothetical protein n=1 Tax=Streptomyces sp. GS7 TaxID=2692234 RepID=UPI00131604FF|nr:hypothetical protein [Streptomyces sp. GS7]QHC24705.1 hypothetical protein GR130_28405 [Streptomyces sp. GS7]
MKRPPTTRLRWGVALVNGVALVGTWTAAAEEAPSGTGPTGAHRAAGHRAAPLWRADPAKGSASFEGVEPKPGSVTVVDDPAGRLGGPVAAQGLRLGRLDPAALAARPR